VREFSISEIGRRRLAETCGNRGPVANQFSRGHPACDPKMAEMDLLAALETALQQDGFSAGDSLSLVDRRRIALAPRVIGF